MSRKLIISQETIRRKLLTKVNRQMGQRLSFGPTATSGCDCCGCCEEDPCSCCSGRTPKTISVTVTGAAADDCVDCTSFNTTYSLIQTIPGALDDDTDTFCREGYNPCFYIGNTNLHINCDGFLEYVATKTFLQITCVGGVVTVDFIICGLLPDPINLAVTIIWSKTTTPPFDCCSAFTGLGPPKSPGGSPVVGDFIGCDLTGSTADVNFGC